MSSKRRRVARARARTSTWLQAEQRRRLAANRAVSLERQAAQAGYRDQGLRLVQEPLDLSVALDEADIRTRYRTPVRPRDEQQERRRTG